MKRLAVPGIVLLTAWCGWNVADHYDLAAHATKIVIRPDGWTAGVENVPTAPTVDAVILSDTSASLTTSAYSGDGSHVSSVFHVVPIDSPWTAANGVFDTLTSGDLTLDTVFALDRDKTWKYRAYHTNSAGTSAASDSLPLATALIASDWSANGAAPVDHADSITAPGANLIDTTVAATRDGGFWGSGGDQSKSAHPSSGVVSAPELGFPSNMLNALRVGLTGATVTTNPASPRDTAFHSLALKNLTESAAGYDLDTMDVGWTFFHRIYQRVSIHKPPNGGYWVQAADTTARAERLTSGGPHFYQGIHQNGGESSGINCSQLWEYKYVPDTLGRYRFSYHSIVPGSSPTGWSDFPNDYPQDSVMMVETAWTKTAEHRYIVRIRIDEEDVSDLWSLPDTARVLDNNCLSSIHLGNNGPGGTWHQTGSGPFITQEQGDENFEWPDGPHGERDRIYYGGFAAAMRPDSTSWIGPYAPPGGQD